MGKNWTIFIVFYGHTHIHTQRIDRHNSIWNKNQNEKWFSWYDLWTKNEIKYKGWLPVRYWYESFVEENALHGTLLLL